MELKKLMIFGIVVAIVFQAIIFLLPETETPTGAIVKDSEPLVLIHQTLIYHLATSTSGLFEIIIRLATHQPLPALPE